jgi:hypothetical protein
MDPLARQNLRDAVAKLPYKRNQRFRRRSKELSRQKIFFRNRNLQRLQAQFA